MADDINSELIAYRLKRLEDFTYENRGKIDQLLIIAARLEAGHVAIEQAAKASARNTGGISGTITGAVAGIIVGIASYFWPGGRG